VGVLDIGQGKSRWPFSLQSAASINDNIGWLEIVTNLAHYE